SRKSLALPARPPRAVLSDTPAVISLRLIHRHCVECRFQKSEICKGGRDRCFTALLGSTRQAWQDFVNFGLTASAETFDLRRFIKRNSTLFAHLVLVVPGLALGTRLYGLGRASFVKMAGTKPVHAE